MISPRHQAALSWLSRQAQLELPWSALQTDDGDRVVTSAKGIYKPAWSKYALSISQRLGSSYDDDLIKLGEPGADPSCYHQEGPTTVDQPYDTYTNAGLLRCMQDAVPVAALVQVSKAPALYSVIGLARVAGWEQGSFLLEVDNRAPGPAPAEGTAPTLESWQPRSGDARERARAQVVRRHGQPAFRRALLEAYRGSCAVTAANAPAALEAAHISPYRGPDSDHVQNGLLLRADIHALFDLGLLAVDSSSMICLVSSSLADTPYADLAGRPLRLPADRSHLPSATALDAHRDWAQL